MSLAELFPEVQSLSHRDKVCLLQFLTTALANDEGISEVSSGTCFAVWSPYGAFEAAQTLQTALQTEGNGG